MCDIAVRPHKTVDRYYMHRLDFSDTLPVYKLVLMSSSEHSLIG